MSAGGYDPLHGYTWPGTAYTTIDWANAAANTFRWNLAVALYRAGRRA